MSGGGASSHIIHRRKLIPVKLEPESIEDLYTLANDDPDVWQAIKLIVDGSMSSKITTHIGIRMPSSEDGGYGSSEVINCTSLNEALNNSLNTTKLEMMKDLLTCGVIVTQMESELPISEAAVMDQYPMMLDIGPNIKGLIVSGKLTDVFGSKTRENKTGSSSAFDPSGGGNPVNGGSSRFLPSSFASWTNDPILWTIPNFEMTKNMVDKGKISAKVFDIDPMSEGEGKLRGTLDQIIDYHHNGGDNISDSNHYDGKKKSRKQQHQPQQILSGSDELVEESDAEVDMFADIRRALEDRGISTTENRSRQRRKILESTARAVQEPLKYTIRRIDPRMVDIYAIVDENGTIIEGRAVPRSLGHRKLKPMFIDRQTSFNDGAEYYPMYGMRVHLCTNYISINSKTFEAEINTPTRKCMMQVQRREMIEHGMIRAMEKNINRKVAATRRDHGNSLGSGSSSGGYPTGSSNPIMGEVINGSLGNQSIPGMSASSPMDQIYFNESRMMENMMLMSYDAMRMDAIRRAEMLEAGFGEISLTGMGYGNFLGIRGGYYGNSDRGSLANIIDHTLPPGILPPNVDMFVYPESVLSPMLLNLIRDKKENVYKIFEVRPVDDIAGGGDSTNVSLRSQFAMASTKNGQQSRLLNEQMRTVYAYMMADMYGENFLNDALSILEYEYEKEDERKTNVYGSEETAAKSLLFTENEIGAIVAAGYRDDSEDDLNSQPTTSYFDSSGSFLSKANKTTYDSWSHLLQMFAAEDYLAEQKSQISSLQITQLMRTFIKHLRLSIIIPGAVNMNFDEVWAAYKTKFLDADTAQDIFCSNIGINHQQKTAPMQCYDDEIDARNAKDSVYKLVSEYNTRKMYNEFQRDETEYEMQLREREAGIQRVLDERKEKEKEKERSSPSSGFSPRSFSSGSRLGKSGGASDMASASFRSNDRKSSASRDSISYGKQTDQRNLRSIGVKDDMLKSDSGTGGSSLRPGAHKRQFSGFDNAESRMDNKRNKGF